jgi:oxygen-independent coproporphyrinogen-3 oxidase
MEPISLYIHWPYCLSLCPYCDFNSHLIEEIDANAWLAAYKKEIDHFTQNLRSKRIVSIFFGGGTPSLMPVSLVAGIIEHIYKNFTTADDLEVTLEANPTSYEAQKFQSFKNAGVNRVSIGVQSFDDEELKLLGRKHSASGAMEAIESASKIFSRYSFDLIYALPGQNLAKWQQNLDFASKFLRDHISLYQLTIEKGTPFFRLHQSGQLELPNGDVAASMYEWTNEYLQQRALERYEISNYAKPGQESRHNLAYWNYAEYIGIGPGAHSRLHACDGNIYALMMYHKPGKWLEMVHEKGAGLQQSLLLSRREILQEVLLMGLRLKSGLTLKRLERNKGDMAFEDILSHERLQLATQNGFVVMDDSHIRLTDAGLLLHNYLVGYLAPNL